MVKFGVGALCGAIALNGSAKRGSLPYEMTCLTCLALFGTLWTGSLAAATEYPLATEEIRVRDPFVVAEGDTYFLYAAKPRPSDAGVDVLESRDLRRWTARKPAMTADPSLGCIKVWAPEVHRYRNKWYLLATLTRRNECQKVEPMPKSGCKLGQIQPRGMWVYVADSPRGPFRPVTNRCLTPPEWMCLDGTLFVEDGKPYMVFCHEWCQVGDGRMMLVELSEDISSFAGEPKELFVASSVGADWHVTDGPCLYRSEVSNRLFMFWSNFGTDGYSAYVKESSSGSVKGPWINRGKLFGKDGGHGMVFKDIVGRLHFVLHQPNKPGGKERMKMFALVDDGNVPHLAREQ